jgi:ABC-type lipoprotein release transport system permease subunit
LSIDGRDVSTFAFEAARGGLLPIILEGHPPAGDDEIALGREVARALHVGIGDEVGATGQAGDKRRLRVVGFVVTPDSAGNGAAMTFNGYRTLVPSATKNVLIVRYRDGASSDFATTIGNAIYSPPGALVTPTSVRALQRVTAAPFALSVVLAVLLVVAGAYLLATSVRARWHDLAVLRALGSDRRQLRAIVHWQSMVVVIVALAIGIPLGVVAGRLVVGSLTDALGIVPGSSVPLPMVGLVIGGSVLIANLLAVVPARRSANADVARLSRDR